MIWHPPPPLRIEPKDQNNHRLARRLSGPRGPGPPRVLPLRPCLLPLLCGGEWPLPKITLLQQTSTGCFGVFGGGVRGASSPRILLAQKNAAALGIQDRAGRQTADGPPRLTRSSSALKHLP